MGGVTERVYCDAFAPDAPLAFTHIAKPNTAKPTNKLFIAFTPYARALLDEGATTTRGAPAALASTILTPPRANLLLTARNVEERAGNKRSLVARQP
jgi:hypothetical protein